MNSAVSRRVHNIDSIHDSLRHSCHLKFATISTVRFNLGRKAHDPALILLIYRFNGKRLVQSTKMTTPIKLWNDREMRVRDTAENLDAEFINDTLERLVDRVNKIHRDSRI